MNLRKLARQRKNKLRKLSRGTTLPIQVPVTAQSSSTTIQRRNRVHRDLVRQATLLAMAGDSSQVGMYARMGVPRLRVEVQRLQGGGG